LPSFELEPAFRFLRTADHSPDPHILRGQFKFEKDFKAMNAEIYLDSVLIEKLPMR